MNVKDICKMEDCCGCGSCYQACPKQAITMVENSEGFLYPTIDESRCVDCQKCKRMCPITNPIPKHDAAFYMAWLKDKKELLKSSSGGAFPTLARLILARKGAVYGAVKDAKTRELFHDLATNDEEMQPMRLSKYYQSNTRRVYKEIESDLKLGKWVLFSGTACQVAGLYSYLGNSKSERLITVDVLCHGVPSKKVIDSFIESQEKRFCKRIKEFVFRIKTENPGWMLGVGPKMKLIFEDESVFIEQENEDIFYAGFASNLFLRESCYRCKFCGQKRISDFTFADYWGCTDPRVSREQLDLGISLILANTEKARQLLAEMKEDMEILPIEPQEAVDNNRNLREPWTRPAARDTFFNRMGKHGYIWAVKRSLWQQFAKKDIRSFARHVVGKRGYDRLKKVKYLIKGQK